MDIGRAGEEGEHDPGDVDGVVACKQDVGAEVGNWGNISWVWYGWRKFDLEAANTPCALRDRRAVP